MIISGLGGLEPFELSVHDDGHVEFEYRALAKDSSPMEMADMATVLLTGNAGPFECRSSGHPPVRENTTFKAIVGFELRSRGINAELETYADEHSFDVFGEVRATSSHDGSDSTVFIGDEAGIIWIRDYWGEYVAEQREPEFSRRLAGKEEITGDVVNRLTLAAGLFGAG